MPKFKLFCLPYAGGSAAVFNPWKKYIDTSIELIPIELSGRGKRIQEPLYASVKDMVDDVFDIVIEQIEGSPFVFFGHSMGGMVAYLLGQRFMEQDLVAPSHIFFSGRSAPHVNKPDEKKYSLMDEETFKKEILELGGTPPEFFEYPELLEVFMPLLKNDFRLAETNISNGKIKPLNTDITVLFGKDEDLDDEERKGWSKHSSKLCNIHYFEGGHFFLHDEVSSIVQIINNTLLFN